MKESLMIFLFCVIGVMNVVALVLMGVDKALAKAHRRRVPERVLFLFAILFGGVGGTLGMFLFRHKTRHWYFRFFFPALAIIQIALMVYLRFYTMRAHL